MSLLTSNIVEPVERHIELNYVHSEEANFFKKQILSRIGNLVLAPLSVITNTADTVIGIGASFASIATLGMHWPTYKFAAVHLDCSRKMIVRPYRNLLKALNPKAEFSGSLANAPFIHRYLAQGKGIKDAFITADGDGFITEYVREALKNVARRCYNSDNFFKRHIASRLIYPLLAISSLITRIADGVIGVIAAPLSLLTLGKVESINNLAYRALQAPGIVNDIFYSTVKFINPFAGT